jgi:hypothetical protein
MPIDAGGTRTPVRISPLHSKPTRTEWRVSPIGRAEFTWKSGSIESFPRSKKFCAKNVSVGSIRQFGPESNLIRLQIKLREYFRIVYIVTATTTRAQP